MDKEPARKLARSVERRAAGGTEPQRTGKSLAEIEALTASIGIGFDRGR